MIYLIEFSPIVEKQLKKLDENTRFILLKKIYKLEINPIDKKHLISKDYYELKHKNYRVYYKVMHGIILVEKVTYKGRVIIERLGTKNSQKKDIGRL